MNEPAIAEDTPSDRQASGGQHHGGADAAAGRLAADGVAEVNRQPNPDHGAPNSAEDRSAHRPVTRAGPDLLDAVA